jgi:hypothetical protein
MMGHKVAAVKLFPQSVRHAELPPAGGCQPFQRHADCSVTACGEEGAGLGRKLKMKPASMKQEVSFVPV